mmetsp:Transcript_19000/g.44666  ORF Transcript_19000/g.44666 Transcript_19000/m.44666 type:complete len:109 (+) Transcript_19000:67-393(+)|eukprot:CAMPEP_0171088216 /NCGR_PEP_ID=MMETSP0766_2-20121228/20645_1 /TAXON_ID=439317 /ORGANISM="Gambierdiscus australes, Strain CAWD 149" /LENGTH=108 /DNA_ID=CAMNT_0011545993 /DNA_START=47 /DNA_END=373 /DNA_ORIENTATION=-
MLLLALCALGAAVTAADLAEPVCKIEETCTTPGSSILQARTHRSKEHFTVKAEEDVEQQGLEPAQGQRPPPVNVILGTPKMPVALGPQERAVVKPKVSGLAQQPSKGK